MIHGHMNLLVYYLKYSNFYQTFFLLGILTFLFLVYFWLTAAVQLGCTLAPLVLRRAAPDIFAFYRR